MRRRGFTIVECAVCILIVGGMFAAAVATMAAAAQLRRAEAEMRSGEVMARSMVAEMRQVNYAPVAAAPAGRTFILFRLLRLLGLKEVADESGPGRMSFDDLNKYNGHVEKGLTARDGTPLAGFEAWVRTVTVESVDPMDPFGPGSAPTTERGLKRITVTVTSSSGKPTTVVAFRSPDSPLDAPGPSDAAVTSVEIEILPTGAHNPATVTAEFNNQPAP